MGLMAANKFTTEHQRRTTTSRERCENCPTCGEDVSGDAGECCVQVPWSSGSKVGETMRDNGGEACVAGAEAVRHTDTQSLLPIP